MDSFKDLKIDSWLLGNIERLGFSKPTEVQEKAIPVVLSGRDMSVRAKTGTGKTGAYMIPILQMLHSHSGKVRAIVIVPTRELSLQVALPWQRIEYKCGLWWSFYKPADPGA